MSGAVQLVGTCADARDEAARIKFPPAVHDELRFRNVWVRRVTRLCGLVVMQNVLTTLSPLSDLKVDSHGPGSGEVQPQWGGVQEGMLSENCLRSNFAVEDLRNARGSKCQFLCAGLDH